VGISCVGHEKHNLALLIAIQGVHRCGELASLCNLGTKGNDARGESSSGGKGKAHVS
jgi:hypothetical protein